MAKGERTKNELQNSVYKTKFRVTRTPLNTGSEHRSSGRVESSCSTSGTRCVIMNRMFNSDKQFHQYKKNLIITSYITSLNTNKKKNIRYLPIEI